jgi:uncharacterized membrane protein YqjE
MTEVRSDGQLEDKSIGELVKIATANASQLVRAEIDLAKTELFDDAKRAGLSGALFAFAGVAGGAAFLMLSFTAAYGLIALGVWRWAAFGIVAVLYAVFGALFALIGRSRLKKMSGVKRTKRSVKDGVAMLRRGGDEHPAITE